MSKSNYPLPLQSSLLDEVRRVAAKEGVSINRFINVAVAEKLSALRTEDYFRERAAARADVPAALALLERLGTEPPRAGDEVDAPDGSADRDGLRLAKDGRHERHRLRRGGERWARFWFDPWAAKLLQGGIRPASGPSPQLFARAPLRSDAAPRALAAGRHAGGRRDGVDRVPGPVLSSPSPTPCWSRSGRGRPARRSSAKNVPDTNSAARLHLGAQAT